MTRKIMAASMSSENLKNGHLEDDTGWSRLDDMEGLLLECCSVSEVRLATNGKAVPDSTRSHVWQVCLGVKGIKDVLAFDEIFDLPEQDVLREDCHQLVDKLGNDDEDKVSILSDLESVLTCYCKSRNMHYAVGNGWLEILAPLLALKLNRTELYNCFYAIITGYIPRDCNTNAQIFHLFRLLMLYHDPEICSFLDTKKIFPDAFAISWFRSLFAANCGLPVIQTMWDVYFQQADPLFIFFLALVILVNAKEQLLAMSLENKQTIIDMLISVPGALQAGDVEDFCSLALYYYLRTPKSFREVFVSDIELSTVEDEFISQALCLSVSVSELLLRVRPASDNAGVELVRFFLVDCRPADQYNSGHLPTAFHLDANLMLQEPQAFSTAVQALFGAQQQAIAANSLAGGEHLCFMGSGREEEDQYVHMVIASFLQKHRHYVSVVKGGYIALHSLLTKNLSTGLVDHSNKSCIVCNKEVLENGANGRDDASAVKGNIIEKWSFAVRSKSAEMKDKVVEFITNPTQQPLERHVSSHDKVGKRYRSSASVFTIDDDHDESEGIAPDESKQEVVSISTWLKKPDVVESFKCEEIKKSGHTIPCYLLLTETHLFVLHIKPNQRNFAHIASRRALSSIVKITSKRKNANFITFKYGTISDDGNIKVNDLDMFFIPKASEATTAIKEQIGKLFSE